MSPEQHHRTTHAALSALVVDWLARYDSHHTRSRYRRDLGTFAAFLHPPGRTVLEATDNDVRAWARHLAGSRADLDGNTCPTRATNSIAVKCSALSSFFRHCQTTGAIEHNPVETARAEKAGSWTNRPAESDHVLDLEQLRTMLCATHRDPYLGGTLGVTLVGLVLACRWRPEQVTALTVAHALDRLTPGSTLPGLPSAVDTYLETWLAERPVVSLPGLFRDRSGQRRITAVDVLRLVHRTGVRADLGDDLTAPRLAKSADALAQHGTAVRYPTLGELRTDHPAPQQLALPDTPDGYDQTEDAGQAALLPLPDNIVPLPRRRRTRRAG